MTGFSNSPRVLKAGLVLLDPETGAIRRIITLQYNPQQLTRTLQVQDAASGGRSEPLRLKGPPVETIRLDAEIDATDQLEFPDENASTVEAGIHPQLAQLESVLYPTSAQLVDNNSLAASGALEILPMESALTLFVWSRNRVLPVRITDFSITEEAFDTALNPIRAKVGLGLRVLSVDDLDFTHKGASLFLSYLQQKESLASRSGNGQLDMLGLGEPP